jgi:hypothetical protein
MPEAMLPAVRPGRGWNGGVPRLPCGSSHAVAYGDARTSVWQLTELGVAAHHHITGHCWALRGQGPLFVPLDAALYDPLPLGISVSYKRGETEKAMASPHG